LYVLNPCEELPKHERCLLSMMTQMRQSESPLSLPELWPA
jgi:hypothetical protein